MIGGSIIVAACLLVLGWTAEIVGLFATEPETVSGRALLILGLTDCFVQVRSCTIALAVLSIYAVDFAINAGQRILGLGTRSNAD